MSDFRIYGEGVPDLAPDNEGSPKLLREPRRLGASAGAAWIGQAWGLFTRRWGIWVGMSFVMLLITTVVSMLPLVGLGQEDDARINPHEVGLSDKISGRD